MKITIKNGIASCVHWSKPLHKNVRKTTKVEYHESEEKAKEFLTNWKLEQEKKDNESMNEKPETKVEEVKPIEKVEEQKKVLPPINYEEFDLNIADPTEEGSTILIYGASFSGKSSQIVNLCHHYYLDSDIIKILISPNNHIPAYKPLKKMGVIFVDKFNEKLVKDIHKIQKKTKNKYAFLLMFDDCIDHKYSKSMLELFLTMRNCLVSTILNLQAITLLTKNSRNNAHHVIFRWWQNDMAIEDTIKMFLRSYEPFKSIENMDDKILMYKDIVKDYGYMYLKGKTGELSFHHKCDLIE